MGYPYNDLIAPAIAYSSPGITREEFTELLDKTHSSYHNYNADDAWDLYDERYQDRKYHEGLEGLAEMLRLKKSEEYKEFIKPKADKNGVLIQSPYMLPAREGKPYRFEVIIHEKNVIEAPKLVEELSFVRLEEGDVWQDCMSLGMAGIVKRIFEEKRIGGGYDKDEIGLSPQYEYKMEIRTINAEYRSEKFNSK